MIICTVYIICFINDVQHREQARKLFDTLRTVKTSAGVLYEPQIFFCEDDGVSVGKILQHAWPKKCDIVISAGVALTSLLQEIYKSMIPLPTLFFGIHDPAAYGYNFMSGVRLELSTSYLCIRDAMQQLHPAIKTIFIPYDIRLDQRNFSIEALITKLAGELQGIGYEVVTQKTSSKAETIRAIKENLAHYHVLGGFGIHLDTEKAAAYMCGMTDRMFISAYGEVGLKYGAAFSCTLFDSPAISESLVQLIQSCVNNPLALSTQPVVTLCKTAPHMTMNIFMLPDWAAHLPDSINAHSSDINIVNIWANCAMNNEHADDTSVNNKKKLNVGLNQLLLLQGHLKKSE